MKIKRMLCDTCAEINKPCDTRWRVEVKNPDQRSSWLISHFIDRFNTLPQALKWGITTEVRMRLKLGLK